MAHDKDLDDVMAESGMGPVDMMTKKDKPEPKKTSYTDAPASVTYTIKTRAGFNALFSIREESGIALLDKMDIIEQTFVTKGIIPQPDRTYGAKKELNIVPGRKCPLCSNDLVETITKTGKKMIKCSTQKYDFNTKTTLGCPFVEWPN